MNGLWRQHIGERGARLAGGGWALLAAAALASGCASSGKATRPPPPGPVSTRPVDSLNLLTTPVALDLDRQPGADGFAVQVYATRLGKAKTQPIRTGALEILLLDGVVTSPGVREQVPIRIWRFEAAELGAHAVDTAIGAGYRLTLAWGSNGPTLPMFSVVARHVQPDLPPVYSAPSAVSSAVR
ncbi:MAG: hypothetical protein KA118_05845 [Verrucomicrobia bacterium]|nr:hypothetical protein [Verrucomicrobiota bacterium]